MLLFRGGYYRFDEGRSVVHSAAMSGSKAAVEALLAVLGDTSPLVRSATLENCLLVSQLMYFV